MEVEVERGAGGRDVLVRGIRKAEVGSESQERGLEQNREDEICMLHP